VQCTLQYSVANQPTTSSLWQWLQAFFVINVSQSKVRQSHIKLLNIAENAPDVQTTRINETGRAIPCEKGIRHTILTCVSFHYKAVFLPGGFYASPTRHLTNWMIDWLTDWLTDSTEQTFLDNPIVAQLIKKFPAFYGRKTFRTVIKRARHGSLSWTR
jgi:hypothetical protein